MSMDIEKTAVIILAAGMGSRMGNIDPNINKCVVSLNKTVPLIHTIKSFHSFGIINFAIIIGHNKNSILEALNDIKIDINITFIENNFYNYHGCEYSLCCSKDYIKNFKQIYITEGDLIIEKSNYTNLINSKQNSVLLRNPLKINPFKSVVAIGSKKVEEFVYDPKHNSIFNLIDDKNKIIGESGQVWKITEQLKLFSCMLEDYYERSKYNQLLDSGIYSINKLLKKSPMKPIFMINDNWLNINTIEDVEKGRNCEWLEI